MNPKKIKKILEELGSGKCTVAEALEQLRTLPYDDLKFAKLDHHRELRKGIPEAIYTPGKTEKQIVGIVERILARRDEAVFTRMTKEISSKLRTRFGSKVRWYPEARMLSVGMLRRQPIGRVLIVTAGTSDIPVAEEAAVTCELLGCRVDRLYDVGVAGIHRLTSNMGQFDKADVIIVLAGMEGALPSVVAGLTSKPVVAVPTSVGYGASFEGIAALLGMLSSCSSGIGVVNIDNGFGAGALAVVIVKNKYSAH
ncbi:MAG: 1-(5-phosphoribosyl)-5-amino-4-imidazole-carboxylate carboxylase [Euryarchaeota archaeon RBG_13_57_23]|nr:MAG: 1-(5-phosphoribosyl)-5-amino-4-imidazole-carboxylate carboxylase [Euryarchaeota archaeon RBG_13_57_23]